MDAAWLKETVGPTLVKALAETVAAEPADPVDHLANLLLKCALAPRVERRQLRLGIVLTPPAPQNRGVWAARWTRLSIWFTNMYRIPSLCNLWRSRRAFCTPGCRLQVDCCSEVHR